MRILITTGKLAEKIVRENSENADVYVCDLDVAAFITPKNLENLDLGNYDIVFVPGLTKDCNWEEFEKKKGVKIRLGPLHASDIKRVLRFVGKIDFSHKIPACKLIDAIKAEEVFKEVNELEKAPVFKIRDISIGGNSRMKIVAEITITDVEKFKEKIEYLSENADIIDIGIPLEFETEKISRIIKIAVDESKKPISVDTFSKKAIEIAVKHGVDMVMSLSSSNIEILEFLEDQAIVVAEKNIESLLKLLEVARKRTEKVIADPILDPPLNVAKSIERYLDFRKLDSETPLLFGVGNVTELSDADSIGINALLAFIAEEIGCNLLFTTEASPKTFGSVKELRIASYLAKISKIRNSPPKDAGVSLLVLKEKLKYETTKAEDFLIAQEFSEFQRDPFGDFIIFISEGKIFCKHEKLTIAGKNAKEILDTVLRFGLVSRLDHAGYLGRELMKAEIALKLGKNYIQDRDLNFGFY
ncbi:MAG: dihydropteroate synthase-like protein [Archaeoglobaceae archaeon]|nr:dihydropteroate synthase-like protein [Archaeoglobaceae archaeon]MDW7989711.1 dihydropteroate synthase-like protein [Archaeoglobaceae archaeon]